MTDKIDSPSIAEQIAQAYALAIKSYEGKFVNPIHYLYITHDSLTGVTPEAEWLFWEMPKEYRPRLDYIDSIEDKMDRILEAWEVFLVNNP